MSATQSAPPGADAGRLHGHAALVTGAGRGLGRGIAVELARRGAEVLLMSRTATELEAAAEDIRGLGAVAAVLPCDVTDREAFAQALDGAAPISVLVNNAGTNLPMPLLDVDEPTFDRLLATNVRSVFFCAQEIARRLITAKRPGVIINISSQMGHVGAANRTVYCATKHAIEGLTKAMAVELAPHRIRVNTVAPTYVETPMTAGFFADPAFRAETLARIPLGRLGTVEDVAAAVAFLASEEAALVTGASLLIDGGYTAQ